MYDEKEMPSVTEVKTVKQEAKTEEEEVKTVKQEAKTEEKEAKTEQNAVSERDIRETKESKAEEAKAGKAKKKKRKAVKGIVALLFMMLVAGMVFFYSKRAVYYQTHFLPNTYINGYDCSDMDEDTVVVLLEKEKDSYGIELTGRNGKGKKEKIGELTAADMQFAFLGIPSGVSDILQQQEEWWWLISLLEKKQYSHDIVPAVTFEEESLRAVLETLEAFQKESVILPQDAYISEYSAEKQGYEIVPETLGTAVKQEAVYECVAAGIMAGATSVDLEEQGCYETAKITSDNKRLQDSVSKANQWLQTQIVYDWNGTEVVVAADTIKDWVSFTEGKLPVPKLDEEAVGEFVALQAKEYDTYGKKRKFVTSLGVELTLPSGAYGWRTDREQETKELIELIYQGSILQREPVYSKKAAKKGANDIGSSYVEADLTNQHMYLYQNGTVVLETDFVSGDMNVANNITPQGVFGITYKTTNAVLRGANYETPVSYWMPFHGNFGMHDAWWRSEFGGTIYLTNGSHGCINLPPEKAAAIYQYVSTGFPVICYYY